MYKVDFFFIFPFFLGVASLNVYDWFVMCIYVCLSISCVSMHALSIMSL